MTGTHAQLMAEIDAANTARADAVLALRAAQDEYLAAERLRKQAARTVLDGGTGVTVEQAADALRFRARSGLTELVRRTNPTGGYVFSRPILVELAELSDHYAVAVARRRELVRELRSAPREERLTFEEMAEAMGLSSEGVRYLTRGSGSRAVRGE